MISLVEPGARKGCYVCYQLHVTLLGAEPTIWRRIQVPGRAKLSWLHAALQITIGWTNSHLHAFQIRENRYSDTRHHFAECEGDPEILEASKYTLQQLLTSEQDSFEYEYDFGDSWRHRVTVEKILPCELAMAKRALCLDGARACPPEDCGGIWGYAELLKILKNRRHPEYREKKRWLGRPWNAEAFNAKRVNEWLGLLKWPRVSDAQLRRLLMGREGYCE